MTNLHRARKAFYELNGIGWCSRPPHCTVEGPNYFLRKGQFKKASNMNYCLDFSLRVEDELLRLIEVTCGERGCTQENLTVEDEDELYTRARNTIIEKDGGRTLAAGDVRLGEIILLIDSDTRVVSSHTLSLPSRRTCRRSAHPCPATTSDNTADTFNSPRTVFSSELWRCTKAPRSHSYNMLPVFSK